MRLKTLLATAGVVAAVTAIAGPAQAVVVMGTANTGEGLAAGDGQVDANYTVISSNTYAVGTQAKTYYNPAYATDGPMARWVNATGDGNGGNGAVTTFRTTFDLTGYDPLTAALTGQAGFDNIGRIFLNGNLIGTHTGFTAPLFIFGSNAPGFFAAGINNLDFELTNIDGPEAFIVAGLTVTADVASTTPPGAVPEPATWGLMGLGFGLVGFAARRRRRTTVVAA